MRLMKFLLEERKYNINLMSPGRRTTPLYIAASEGQKKIVLMLLENGAGIELGFESQDYNFLHRAQVKPVTETPLHAAVEEVKLKLCVFS
jgi:ankyrin repeat protein